MRGIRQALRLTWQTSKLLTGLFILMTLVAVVPGLAVAWLTKALIDTLTGGGAETGEVVALGLALALAGLVGGVAPFALQYAQKETERRLGLVTQDKLFAATERFTGMVRFEDPEFLDRLRLAQQYGGATPGIVVATALSMVRTSLTAIGFLGSLVILSPWIPVLVLGSALPVLVCEVAVARRRAMVQNGLGPIERRELFYRELLTNVQAALHGTISLGDISLLLASIAGVQTAMLGLMRDVGNAHQQLLLFENFLVVLDSGPDLPVAVPPRPVPPLRDRIEFRDVWFRYGPDQPWVLAGVSFTVEAGRTVGLIGRNGAGKSTLVKLLSRMYDPVRGSILWDGVDLRELDPAGLRDRIGAVFQDYMKYDLTAAENIALGDISRRTDRAMIESASRNAGSHAFVSRLPRSYDTLLSRIFFEGELGRRTAGVTLSGGQWQRLAIARAYARGERDLVILDEPSSGLDAEAEAEVHRGLSEHRAGRTSLLISHRLGSLRIADDLVVLDEGQVVEQGTHDSLVRRGGLYAGLFALQAEGYRTALTEAS